MLKAILYLSFFIFAGNLQAAQLPANNVTGSTIFAASDILEKVSTTTPAFVLTKSISTLPRVFHLEAGATLATMTATNWPIPTSPSVDIFYIQNNSTVSQTLTVTVGVGNFAGLRSMDGVPNEGSTYTILNNTEVMVMVDHNGFVQVAPYNSDAGVSQSSVKYFSFEDNPFNMSTNSTSFVAMSIPMRVSTITCNVGGVMDISALINRVQHNSTNVSTFFQLRITQPNAVVVNHANEFALGDTALWNFKQMRGEWTFTCTQAGNHTVNVFWRTSGATTNLSNDVNGSGSRSLKVRLFQ